MVRTRQIEVTVSALTFNWVQPAFTTECYRIDKTAGQVKCGIQTLRCFFISTISTMGIDFKLVSVSEAHTMQGLNEKKKEDSVDRIVVSKLCAVTAQFFHMWNSLDKACLEASLEDHSDVLSVIHHTELVQFTFRDFQVSPGRSGRQFSPSADYRR
eukprot:GHVH01017255.1.p1 GENE.GHVH01017255.1~~GHVH01017255.1.p1  ORF type:complete len:156 (-),score=12.55 GHVH01017255.1:398-865(-)